MAELTRGANDSESAYGSDAGEKWARTGSAFENEKGFCPVDWAPRTVELPKLLLTLAAAVRRSIKTIVLFRCGFFALLFEVLLFFYFKPKAERKKKPFFLRIVPLRRISFSFL